MGRCPRRRSSLTSPDQDLTQRSRRRKNATTKHNNNNNNNDGSDSSSATTTATTTPPPVEEGNRRPLFHCNYCNKDISGKIHIKCALCIDFDLCVECFSVGSEVTPHKSNHPYRVMDDLSFPLLCSEWNADEEILLLEGFEMFGLGDWDEIAEHVGTKTKTQCIDHYTHVYLNSLCFPLPDMSRVAGKNRNEIFYSSKGHCEDKKGYSSITAAAQGAGATKKASNMPHIKHGPDFTKVEDSQVDWSSGFLGKKPELAGDEGQSLIELSGFNLKRREFDPEYDNDAEQSIADMEFKDDTKDDHELKLLMLHIYNKRLDERKHRKDFILERNLLYADPFVKDFSPQEREIYHHYNVFMRFHSREEHAQLIGTVIQEHRTRKRIQELKEAQRAGCRTSSEAVIYLACKRKKEAEESAFKDKGSPQVGSSCGVLQRVNRFKGEPESSSQGGAKESSSGKCRPKDSSSSTAQPDSSSFFDDWNITGLTGSHLLSETEKRLCCETKMLPSLYLKLQEVMSIEVFRGNITKKSDAYRFFTVDPNKVDRVYDMLVRKGIALP